MVRCNGAYRSWVARLMDRLGKTEAETIDEALRRLADQVGLSLIAPQRCGAKSADARFVRNLKDRRTYDREAR